MTGHVAMHENIRLTIASHGLCFNHFFFVVVADFPAPHFHSYYPRDHFRLHVVYVWALHASTYTHTMQTMPNNVTNKNIKCNLIKHSCALCIFGSSGEWMRARYCTQHNHRWPSNDLNPIVLLYNPATCVCQQYSLNDKIICKFIHEILSRF